MKKLLDRHVGSSEVAGMHIYCSVKMPEQSVVPGKPHLSMMTRLCGQPVSTESGLSQYRVSKKSCLTSNTL